MQQSSENYYRYLRVGKLASSLTPDEEKRFQELLENNGQFRKEFILLQEKIPNHKLKPLERFKNNDQWSGLMSQLEQQKSASVFSGRNLSVSFVIVAALCIGGWLFFKSDSKTTEAIKSSPGIQLILAQGKTINLSDSSGVLQTEETIINNTGEALTYSNKLVSNTGINTLTVAPGLDYKITLSDGTKVWMNSTTRLDFPFNFPGNTREIKINGEAYLEVAKDPTKPFIVHLPQSSILVTGTSFNVNSYTTNVNNVSLVEGSVIMKGHNIELKLKPGQQGITANGSLIQKDFDPRKTLSWREGILYFDGTPLTEIVKVIPRWFNTKVVIDNSRNTDKLFVGIVNKHKTLNVFLKDLQEVAEIDYYFDKQGILHFK